MTRAADEPQYAAPVRDRLGYLRHMITDLDVASPDTLHGAAHLAPLAGIEFPMLQILADINDAAIEAGLDADLDELARLRGLTRSRLVAAKEHLAEDRGASGMRPHDEIILDLHIRGEVMTVEVLLLGSPARLGPPAAARLRSIADDHVTARQLELIDLAAGHLDARDPASALVVLRSLIEDMGMRPLDG